MKITTTNTPSWFWSSKSFTEGKRLPDYSTLPSITLPSNKVSASMLRKDTDVPLISGGHHPLERIGYNAFYTNHGGLTTYPVEEKVVKFTDIAYNGSNYTDESQWGMAHYPHKYQLINGENPFGYNGIAIASNTSKRDKLREILGSAIAEHPYIKIFPYPWTNTVTLNEWYNVATDSGILASLIAKYSDANLIYSPQIDCGFNAMCQQIYSINDSYYDYPAYYILQKQFAYLKYPNIPFYGLLWSQTETVDGFPVIDTVKRKRSDGAFINLKQMKGNAPAEYMYNCALACLTIGDGIFGWEGLDNQIDSEDNQYEIHGYAIDLVEPQVPIGSESWVVASARGWTSCIMYWNLAMQHVSQFKDIIQDTTYWWQTPDFEYRGNTRTGIYKLIPYNKYYQEPVVQLKYNADKSQCLIFVMNCWVDDNISVKPIRVFDTTTGLNVIVTANGTKAELFKVEL